MFRLIIASLSLLVAAISGCGTGNTMERPMGPGRGCSGQFPTGCAGTFDVPTVTLIESQADTDTNGVETSP